MEPTICALKNEMNTQMGFDPTKLDYILNQFENWSTTRIQTQDFGRFQVNFYDTCPMKNKCKKQVIDREKLTKSVIYPEKSDDSNNQAKTNTDNACKNIHHVKKKRLSMEQYWDIKNQRDLECLKLSQVSQALCNLYQQSEYGFWDLKLYIEKILLQSGETVNLMVNKIRDDSTAKEFTKGTMSLSSFRLKLKNFQSKRANKTEFFVLLLINGTQVLATKVERNTAKDLTFNDELSLSIPSTMLQLKVYSIFMQDKPKRASFTASFRKKSKRSFSTYKILYENVYTHDMVEDYVIRSSFRLCAEASFLPYKDGPKKYPLKLYDGANFEEHVSFETKIQNVRIVQQQAGFLTLGRFLNKNGDLVVWNRQWCVLENEQLNFYGCPNETIWKRPFVSVSLALISNDKIEKASKKRCGRDRCLVLEIGDAESIFLRFDTNEELKLWASELNLALELLKLWHG